MDAASVEIESSEPGLLRVDELSQNVDQIFIQVDQLEKRLNEVEQFYSKSGRKQSNTSKASSVIRDKDKDKPVSSFKRRQQDASRREASATRRMQDLMRQFNQLLQKHITGHQWAGPFLKPVDVVGLELHDYNEIIKKPMDFSTIDKKWKAKDGSGYTNVREMYADVRLIFKNAMKYNKETHDVHVMAKTLLDKFEEKWLQLLPKVDEEVTFIFDGPPMVDKTNYSLWVSRMLLYTIDEEKLHESVDITATNIVLQGLPQDIYNLVNHNDIWDMVKLLIQVSELSLQERESKLYDDFDTFTSMPGETIHSYYMRFAQLINDMYTIGTTMRPLQVNTKFVNHLPPEWSKFVTDVKLAKDMLNTNFDHLYAHLRQHEAHANEVRLIIQRYPDQIALVANSPSCLNPAQYYPHMSSVTQQYYLTPTPQHSYDTPMVPHSRYQPSVVNHSSVAYQPKHQQPAVQQPYQAPALQPSYQPSANYQPLQSSYASSDSGLAIPTLELFDNPFDNLNKLQAFVTSTFASRFLQTINQLRTSSNLRNQATIQDGRVTMQLVQGRQTQGYANNRTGNNATSQVANRNGFAGQARVVKCFNCQELKQSNQMTLMLLILIDYAPSAKAVLMANLSSCDSDVLSEVLTPDTPIEVAMYSQNTENPVVQNTSSSAQQEELLMTVITGMTNQVAKCTKVKTAVFELGEFLTKGARATTKLNTTIVTRLVNLHARRNKETKILRDLNAISSCLQPSPSCFSSKQCLLRMLMLCFVDEEMGDVWYITRVRVCDLEYLFVVVRVIESIFSLLLAMKILLRSDNEGKNRPVSWRGSIPHAFALSIAISVGANVLGGRMKPAVTFGILLSLFFITAENVNVCAGTASLLPLVGTFIADGFLSRYLTIIAAFMLYIMDCLQCLRADVFCLSNCVSMITLL
uniref:Transcription factor GTE1-like n=1 Tax=Tanacetum cinerariifolium TaxID=118510 RepID=A0A6L2MVT2_TANCI|nr:transcription factor GTE1-like [Tanacetum cinerariifolium]